MNYRLQILGLTLAFLMSSQAQAETAADFLQSLEGNYSGRGKATFIGDKKTKVACKISNTFTTDNANLVVSGECASTRGKGKVNGLIIANNNSVKGSFVAPRKGMEVTQSSGSYADGIMQLSTSMVDQEIGRLLKVRQIISRTESGISAKFFVYDNLTKTYEPSGAIDLKKL